jgi:hypothetical protein
MSDFWDKIIAVDSKLFIFVFKNYKYFLETMMPNKSAMRIHFFTQFGKNC